MRRLTRSKVISKPLIKPVKEKETDPNRKLKIGVWIYFLLLIFEGALRKWVLPGLSTPLLIIRDPVALWLLIVASKRDLLPFNIYTSGMIFLGIIGIFTAVAFGHGNFMVAVYGARILALHFPLIFAIGRILNRDDVVKMGRVLLIISIPMAILIALQFYSPQSAWVNKAVGGGDEGGGFSGALDYFRPPATFSFTNGTTMFFGLVGPFVIYFWLNPKKIEKIVLIGATIGLLSAIPLSISRALFFQVLISMIFAVIAISRKPEYMGKMITIMVAASITLLALSRMSFFQKATEAFTVRFEGANEYEGGVKSVLADRYLGNLLGGIAGSGKQSTFGLGLGIGTSVGGSLLTGEASLQLGEGEWDRVLGEMGVLMGLAVIFLRVGVCVKISLAAYRRLSSGDLLPWLLLSFCLLIVPQGQWGQPTSLGFGIIAGGLTIAALQRAPRKKNVRKTGNIIRTANQDMSPKLALN